MSFIEDIESAAQSGKFAQTKASSNALSMLWAKLTAGRNNDKLARILTTYDFAMLTLGYKDKPIAKFSELLTGYQASIDGHYHNDLKAVLIAEEQVKRQAERKGISIVNDR